MTIFDHYDQIRIVNLAHRTDRRREMERQLERVGLLGDPRVEFFDAYAPDHPSKFASVGAFGVFESHRRLLATAAKGGESILILEDDCNFLLPDILEYQMPACDVFYGGYHALDDNDLEYSDIIGAHFMGFSAHGAKVAAAYLFNFLKPDFEPVPAIAAPKNLLPRPGIDGAYVWLRRTYPELATVFADLIPAAFTNRHRRSEVV